MIYGTRKKCEYAGILDSAREIKYKRKLENHANHTYVIDDRFLIHMHSSYHEQDCFFAPSKYFDFLFKRKLTITYRYNTKQLYSILIIFTERKKILSLTSHEAQ